MTLAELTTDKLYEVGFILWEETEAARYGYPIGCDLYDCLWFEVVNTVRLGVDWRKAPDNKSIAL